MNSGVFFLFRYAWRNEKKYVIYSLVAQILSAAVPLCDIVFPKFILDELLGEKRLAKLFIYVALLIIITVVGKLLISFCNKQSRSLRSRLFATFQADMAERLAACDFERLEDSDFLNTKEKAEKFLYADGQGFCVVLDNVFVVFGKVLTFIGIVAVIATLSFWVVIIFVGLVLLNAWYESRVKKEYVVWDMEKAPIERRTSYFISLISDFAFGKEIRVFGIRSWLVDKIRNHLNQSYEFYKKQTNSLFKAQYVSAVVNFFLKGITYVYLIFQAVSNLISIGDFTMYVSSLTQFSAAMTDMMSCILTVRQFEGYYDALQAYMAVPQNMRAGKKLPLPQGPYEVRFENVSFCYAGQETYALQHVNITLHSGEKLSIVGENGAGKTTFVKLLCRLYDPTEGRILLNGIDIKDIDYDEYMRVFGSVFQDYRLFSFSLKDNIALQNADREADEKVICALRKAGFSDKLDRLPDGIQTYVYKNFSENGFEPSGGEGQKIALARAIYKDAPIIILDEPTAALDPRAEYEIYQKFSDVVSGRTAVFISHRLSSAKVCDRIAVFHNGEIVEYGTHDELISMNGRYHELFHMQAQFYM